MPDWLQITLAIIGAVSGISGLTLGWINLYLRWQDRRLRLKLETRLGFAPDSVVPEAVSTVVLFKVINSGGVEATISKIFLLLDDGREMGLPGLQGERSIPCRLPPKDHVRFWTLLEGVQGGLRTVGYSGMISAIPVAEDATGIRYTAERVDIPVNGDGE